MEEFTNEKQIRLDKAKNAILLKRALCKNNFGQTRKDSDINSEQEERVLQEYEQYKKTMSAETKHFLFMQSVRDDRGELLKKEYNLNNYVGEQWQTLSYIVDIYMFETACIEEFFSVLIPKKDFLNFFSELIEPIIEKNNFEMGFSQKVRNKWIIQFYWDRKEDKLPIVDESLDLV